MKTRIRDASPSGTFTKSTSSYERTVSETLYLVYRLRMTTKLISKKKCMEQKACTKCYPLCKVEENLNIYIFFFLCICLVFIRSEDVTKNRWLRLLQGELVAEGQEGERLFILYPLVPFEF